MRPNSAPRERSERLLSVVPSSWRNSAVPLGERRVDAEGDALVLGGLVLRLQVVEATGEAAAQLDADVRAPLQGQPVRADRAAGDEELVPEGVPGGRRPPGGQIDVGGAVHEVVVTLVVVAPDPLLVPAEPDGAVQVLRGGGGRAGDQRQDQESPSELLHGVSIARNSGRRKGVRPDQGGGAPALLQAYCIPDPGALFTTIMTETMHFETKNLRVTGFDPLPAPRVMVEQHPLTEHAAGDGGRGTPGDPGSTGGERRSDARDRRSLLDS